MTHHAETRIKERFEQLGYKSESIKECLARIDELSSSYPKENVGFLLRKFDRNMVTDFSNGDELWLILRDGRPITCFLRRSTQTTHQRRTLEQQLQVDYTVRLNCLDDNGWKEAPTVSGLRYVPPSGALPIDFRPDPPDSMRDFARSVMESMISSAVDTLRLGVPRLTYDEANRLIAGRRYSVLSPQELRCRRMSHSDCVVGCLESGNYVVTHEESSYVNDMLDVDFDDMFNEDNTER